MSRKELDFSVFCIEAVAENLGTNGADIYTKLSSNSDILDTYIIPNYDALHSQGKEYIVNDIISIMREEGLLP